MHWKMVPTARTTLPLSYLQWLIVLFVSIGWIECKKKLCVIQNGRADCSHMSLNEIPQDLPYDISALDISHNRLIKIAHQWLSPYRKLVDIDASFNSISKLDEQMCQVVPLLQILNMEKNQMLEPNTQELSHCINLVWLNMASNRLKLKGEPFAGIQSLKFLEVSKNNLMSAKLSMKPEILNLIYLGLSNNDITILKTGDLNFLRKSSLRVLNLSSVRLKTVEPGSFKHISSLQTLVLDGSKIGTSVLTQICMELSGSDIKALSLKNIELVSLTNKIFSGLKNTNINSIDVSDNELGEIDEGSFLGLNRLESLSMADNKIKLLKKDTFEGLHSLKMLNMTRTLANSKRVSQPIIENYAFQHLGSLETLILQSSAIGEVGQHTFTGLTSLKDLDLSWTKHFRGTITNWTFVSLMASPLKNLNLKGTALKQIQVGAFSFLKNLTQLHLEWNFITQTITGDEFKGLEQLEELYLFHNTQITLTSNSFYHILNLKILKLAKSLIGTTLNFESSPFKPLSELTILDLSNNNIANIQESLFEGLVKLKVLYLQHNNLARLWKSANVGGPVMFLKGVPNLVTLQLDSNGFDEIPENGLKGLFNLTHLNLSGNLLNNLKESVFDDLLSLQILNMQKNMITAVMPQVFQTPMTNLKFLVMDKNPFDCTCESILWFVTWLNSTNTSVPGLTQEYTCNTPLSYFNKSIMEFDSLSCKDMTPFQTLYILSSTAVLLLMVTALVLRFQGWRLKFYCNILISRTLGLGDAKADEGKQYEFDAYLIHAEEDTSWVERKMLPLERHQCRFCLEDRDSIPGMSQLESIVDNIRRSRKLLFVVTDNLLNDPWCRRFTVHHALHQVIENSRDSVVLVLREDIHDHKLSRALFLRRGMLRPCCIVHWPPQRERLAAFHQNLLIALGKTNHWLQ